MENQPEIYEYELIDITFELEYELQEEDAVGLVCEDEPINDADTTQIEYDADGIPMGKSMEDIRKRQSIIVDFLSRWREANTEGRIMNESLQEYIYFRNVSFSEAKEHSSKSYKSTRAMMIFEEIVKSALPVRRVAVKKNDRNQSSFAYMLVMVYRHQELGTIKLTVGVRLSGQRIQYGITALKPGESLIKNDSKSDKQKKRRSRK
ncbi:MAG: hypothetical protein Q4E68_05820 [Prevotellaceae bacterium]|nr:hypothetical protein [Prevotellaceae bacterium]